MQVNLHRHYEKEKYISKLDLNALFFTSTTIQVIYE